MTITRETFALKIQELGESLYLSHFHLKINEWMTHESNKRLQEYPPFFYLSRMAHYETGLLKLTRAYDDDLDSLTLLKVLNMIGSNYRYWGCSETLDHKILEDDKKFVREDNLVKKLKHLRDKTVAHTDHRQFPSRIGDDIAKVYKKYGDDFYWQQGRITTEPIEQLPTVERNIILNQISQEVFEVVNHQENKILDKDIPAFSELYQLTTQGVIICNRYMQKLSMPPIELKLEGINF
ncbi:hypothetical protein [Anabaena catenula]|uniref:HEPN AbiU2-like domain-containing protein n=1 Tax=Anabaena catenula FACHB-362 TaxID=2692877 RepID=A0ABR8J7G1_9NOST|nr:hypothetical protein [Anabaena catenula]MBD2694150.1 hypothetical protein [Anabaena catenula FACHB-362]